MIETFQTSYGFSYGDALVERWHKDDKKEWVVIGLMTSKYAKEKHIQIYVTKTGKVRIFDSTGEWKRP